MVVLYGINVLSGSGVQLLNLGDSRGVEGQAKRRLGNMEHDW